MEEGFHSAGSFYIYQPKQKSMKDINKISFQESGRKGVAIGYVEYDTEGIKGNTSKEWKKIPHKDFSAALQGLAHHMLFLTEFQDTSENFSKEAVDANKFRVTGVSISGKNKEGVIISGYKTLSNGRGFAFNTPLTNFIENEGYPFVGLLAEAIKEVLSQADQYLKGKYGVEQGEIFGKETPAPAGE